MKQLILVLALLFPTLSHAAFSSAENATLTTIRAAIDSIAAQPGGLVATDWIHVTSLLSGLDFLILADRFLNGSSSTAPPNRSADIATAWTHLDSAIAVLTPATSAQSIVISLGGIDRNLAYLNPLCANEPYIAGNVGDCFSVKRASTGAIIYSGRAASRVASRSQSAALNELAAIEYFLSALNLASEINGTPSVCDLHGVVFEIATESAHFLSSALKSFGLYEQVIDKGSYSIYDRKADAWKDLDEIMHGLVNRSAECGPGH